MLLLFLMSISETHLYSLVKIGSLIDNIVVVVFVFVVTFVVVVVGDVAICVVDPRYLTLRFGKNWANNS